MRNIITIFFFCLLIGVASAQTPGKTSLYLEGQYNKTLSDATKGNNPWGIGLGLQLFLRKTSLITPTIEITADLYLMNDKVYRAYSRKNFLHQCFKT